MKENISMKKNPMVMTLCGRCLSQFYFANCYRIRRADECQCITKAFEALRLLDYTKYFDYTGIAQPSDEKGIKHFIKEDCTYCGCRKGYDYCIYPKRNRIMNSGHHQQIRGGRDICCIRTAC